MILKAISLIYGYLKNFNFKKVEIVDQDTKQERLLFCNSCIHKKNDTCSLCGCIVTSKVIFKNEKCPDKRWS
jgi:hypothetical protein